ncbi:MAG TPA: hypothetical protein VFI15_04005 [Candidatus Limnocylindrales bacterium]|nr:hypothetical protein [Candidatus Limnocylindrales bacterium]
MRRQRPVAIALVLAVAACTTTAPTVAPTAPPPPDASPIGAVTARPSAAPGTPDRVAGWQADLAMLIPGMERLHVDLYHGVSEEALTAAVHQLSATVVAASDDELLDGVLRVVAMVSAGGCDAHTGAYIWGSGDVALDSLPLRLWLFGDDVVVVAALAPYADLVGKRIVMVEGHPIADVLEAIDPLVPRDNEQTVRLLTPRFLLIPQVLRGLGLADGGAVTLGLDDRDGTASTSMDVDPVPMAEYNAWAGAYGLHLPADPAVLYLSRIDDALWWQLLDDGATLFVQDNRVDPLDPKLVAEVGTAMRDPAVRRVVLDLRHNYGGELHALEPIEALFQDPAFDEPGRLFVATGRNTFSAGSLLVARLQRDTAADIVGEPMGGCPTFWSDPATLDLPWSGIEIGVADDVAVGVDPNDTRHGILPDNDAELTIADWRAGNDPVVASITGIGP